MSTTDSKPPSISSDPATIPDKAKAGFSAREVGYIMAELYSRLNKMQGDDGGGACSDIQIGFNMYQRGEEVIGHAFRAGWNAFMIEHNRGWMARQAQRNKESSI